jgi:flagellar motor switch/type III secretory pathway protein FliN
MTLDQLMNLTPGNTLEIPIHPDQGVSLTVNGQKVGRAELVYLGEQLGLRILEI